MNSVSVRLTSNPMIHAPGIFRYAQHGYKTSRKKADKQRFVNIIMSWEHPMMDETIVHGILSGKVDVTIFEDAGEVEFTIETN